MDARCTDLWYLVPNLFIFLISDAPADAIVGSVEGQVSCPERQDVLIAKLQASQGKIFAMSNGNARKSNGSPHIIVMTDAGKLIFSTWPLEDHEQLNNVCGLIQALKASTLNDEALDYGEIQFLKIMNRIICLWNVGAISLVAVSNQRTNNEFTHVSSEVYLRLILEQIYCGMIFLLTDSLQEQLIQNPNLDMAEILGPTSSTLILILRGMGIGAGSQDESELGHNELFTHLGGVDVFGPVPYEVRLFRFSNQVLGFA